MNWNNIYGNKLLKRRKHIDKRMDDGSPEKVFKVFYLWPKDSKHMHARSPFKGIIEGTIKIFD